ncbi:MAG: AraC family transcriptional regulator [Myxococcales bacterium]|nr:AraC family transcriptional regulator [Myxococcales bacterium]
MDVLSDVLSWLRVQGTLSRRSELSAPWGIAYSAFDLVSFMVVEKGGCFLTFSGGPTLRLDAGDLVMLFPGHTTSLMDELSTPTVPYAQVLEECTVAEVDRYARRRDSYPTITYGGGGRQTVLRGWGLRFEGYEQHPLLPVLPDFIHLTYERRSALPWLETTLRFLLHETRVKGDGSDMMTVRLVDLLFVQVLRAWFEEQPDEQVGWLGALRDSSIGHALQLIHEYPADPWSLQGLAKAVGMSRSSFSSRFQSLVGASPMKYLTQLRMNLAANLLRGDTRLSLSHIARQVGYDSESSFGRAFKRTFQTSPGAFRSSCSTTPTEGRDETE